jgi:hypothetical protein
MSCRLPAYHLSVFSFEFVSDGISALRRHGAAMSSKHRFRSFDGPIVELDHDLLVVAADHHEVDGLDGAEVQLLMRYMRREIDEITGTHIRCIFEPLSPTYLAPTAHNVDGDLVAAVVVRPGLGAWLERDCADPGFFPSDASEIERRRPPRSRRPEPGQFLRSSAHNRYAGSPLRCFRHRQFPSSELPGFPDGQSKQLSFCETLRKLVADLVPVHLVLDVNVSFRLQAMTRLEGSDAQD